MHRQWKGKIRVNTPCVLENKEDLIRDLSQALDGLTK